MAIFSLPKGTVRPEAGKRTTAFRPSWFAFGLFAALAGCLWLAIIALFRVAGLNTPS